MSEDPLQSINLRIYKGFFLLLFICLAAFAQAQDSTIVKEEFKSSGKVWGYTFGDYAYKLKADSAKRGNAQYSALPENYNSFNFRRIYLGYDYQFTSDISSQIILAHESNFEAEEENSTLLPGKNRGIIIKAMNLQFKNIIPRASIVAGQQSTPTFSRLSESYWGYRSIEKTLIDMHGISGSTDLGIGVFGKIGKAENVGYDLLVGNSNGTKLENNSFKKIYTSLYAFFLDKKLVVQGNYEHDRKALDPVRKDFTTLKVFVGYKTPETSIGLEAFKQMQTNQSTFLQGTTPSFDTAYADAQAEGISLFANQQISGEKFRLFARFDLFNPDVAYRDNRNYLPGYKTNKVYFATLGLDYSPYKNIHLMPNIWFNQYNNKLPGAGGSLKKDYDLTARITLYYLFNK